jgi:hypothetical protein
MTIINFKECPSFSDVYEMAKDFYVIRSASSAGIYGIVLELTGNGKINSTI